MTPIGALLLLAAVVATPLAALCLYETWTHSAPRRPGPAGPYCRHHVGRPRLVVLPYDREKEGVA